MNWIDVLAMLAAIAVVIMVGFVVIDAQKKEIEEYCKKHPNETAIGNGDIVVDCTTAFQLNHTVNYTPLLVMIIGLCLFIALAIKITLWGIYHGW